jgi:hypothetical protein
MADVTITNLPNATTPLSGTERVPMDQGGVTRDASTQDIANLAGTAITAAVAAHAAASDPHPTYLTQAEGNALYAVLNNTQPLDSDLTAIAALTTTAYGRGFLALTDAAAARTAVGLSLAVVSDVTGITGADRITNIVSLTQAEYDAITPNASTFYVIV